MKSIIRALIGYLAIALLLLGINSLSAASIGQWDFDAGNLSASAGATLGDLQYVDGPSGATHAATQFGTTTSLGIPAINGSVANVMKFPAATTPLGYLMPTPPNANGGGSIVNDYTLILDALYPTNDLFRPVIQTDDGGDGTIAYLAVSAGNQIGATNNHTILPSGFNGQIQINTWYRLGFVVSRTAGQITEYINGVQVGVLTGISGVDNAYALLNADTARILSNTDTNAGPGYVNSIQIRDVALNPGQMQALGGPSAGGIPITIPAVPSFIASRSPDLNATGVPPTPNIQVVIDQGDTTISTGTISLSMDGSALTANVSGPANNQITVSSSMTSILDPLSPHLLTLRYQDSVAGFKTNTWTFTVANYQNITLPAPIYLETFDELAEGTLPPGWSVTNNTVHQTAGFDLNTPISDAYLSFVVLTSNRFATVFPFDNYRRLQLPPIVLNGVVVDRLVHGSFAYADSDQRQNDGGQVQVMFTGDYDLTGHTNVFVAWKSTYEQNQDNIASVEYSIDQGATWLPILYCFDDGNSNPADNDIVRTNGVIDVQATFGTPRGDQAYGLPYSAFIGATVSTNLIPYIGGRINDDPLDGKRIEVVRLLQADGKSKVRFRFCQAGTSSWYFGVDDFGLYSINTPVISVQPQSQTIDAGTPVTFGVTAVGGGPLTYQWKFNGININNATGQTYTIASVSPSDAGNYTVVVTNPDGPAKSSPAQLTVVTQPQILSQPLSQVADPGANVTFNTTIRGGRPLSNIWLFNGSPLGAPNTNNLTINNAQAGNSGTYQLIVTNAYGSVTSTIARLTIFSGQITNCLVAHLGFDSNFADSSGRGNNATYQFGGANGDPTPTFVAGQIGQAFQFTTLQDGSKIDYATFGYPNDLKFGASNDFSVSMWVNYNNQVDDPPFLSNKDWASSDNLGWGIFTQGGPNFRVNITGPNRGADKMSTTATPAIRDGTWHNIVVSALRNGFVYIYVDGALVNTTPLLVQGTIDTDSLNYRVDIGQDGRGDYTDGGSAQNIDAKIDDLGIWCRGLTAHEAASIYAQGIAHNDLTTANGSQITPPTIGTQPVSQIISAGGSVSFSVTANGAPPITYRWQKDGVDVGGGNAATLTISPAQSGNAGAYQAIVTNPGGSVTSKVAQLQIVVGSVCKDLVAHLTFDNDLNDWSGHANNAHYAASGANASASPTFVAGKIGQAFRFTTLLDGSRIEYASFGYPPDLLFNTNDFSVSFWVNYDNSVDDPPYLSNKNWDSSSNIGWGLFTQGGGNFRVNVTGTPRGSGNKMDATLSQIVRNNGWHHIVASCWRGQNTYTYIDGTNANVAPLVIAGSVDTADQGYAVNIGQDGRGTYTDGGSAQIVDCSIDDLGIWRRALTPQDVASIYASGQAGAGLPVVRIATITDQGATLTLTWTGNCPSYKVQHKLNLSDTSWTDDTTTSGLSATIAKPAGTAFFRINTN